MEADLQLGFNALKEASRGTMLVLSALVGEGLKALDDAGAEYSPVGSVDKKAPEEPAKLLEERITLKASAVPEGEKRTISDLRGLNEQTRKQAGQVFLETGLTTPDAVCPRLAGVVRYIRLVHNEYQVGVQMTLMDFEGAYKLMLMALCDVGAQAAALPVGHKFVEVEDALRALGERWNTKKHERAPPVFPVESRLRTADEKPGHPRDLSLFKLVASSGAAMFGGSPTPGEFGVVAWPVVDYTARTGFPEKALNREAPGAAPLHVDDALLMTAHLGMAIRYAEGAYVAASEAMFNKGCINNAKRSPAATTVK